MNKIIRFLEQISATNVDCEKDGHYLVEATDPSYWWCIKCGQYFTKAPQSKFYEDCILL